VIDVLSHGSIYDSVEPYDSVAWGIPYLVGVDHGAGAGAS
jgi:hypothetical protein